jgi:hypothetical protein
MEGVTALPGETRFTIYYTSSISQGLCTVGIFSCKNIVQYMDWCALYFDDSRVRDNFTGNISYSFYLDYAHSCFRCSLDGIPVSLFS